jgi:anti-anti-sigma factor
MPIQTHRSDDRHILTIRIEGRFDFSTHQAFRNAYEHEDREVKGFIVDLSRTTYLDSSALGMLLLLRDYAGGDGARIELRNCNNDVRRILTISNFEQLFSIQ